MVNGKVNFTYLKEILIPQLAKDVGEECREKLLDLIDLFVVDPKLKIPNRIFLELFASREISLAKRYGTGASLLFVDADGLKKINDTYGHEAGDRYLKLIVDAIKKSIRSSDLLIRWGGDEFVVLLHTDSLSAFLIKERIEKELSSTYLSVNGEKVPVSASIGVAAVSLEGSLDEAVKKADENMYEEKKRKKAREER